MARQTRADDSAFEDVQRGKQRGRAVTFVVVGHRAGPAGLHRQAGLGSLQRLDLALFVDTEDQGLVGRVDIQADDVGELLDEPRVGRQFERPDAVRLQSMSVPNAMNRGRAQPLRGGHRPQTPVGGPRRLGVQRGVYDLLLASCGNLAFAPAARGIVGQHVWPPGGATRAPYPGSCRAVERCTCSAGRQRRATRCGSATPRAAPWCRLEASVPASRGALASVAKRGLGSCRARYQSPVGSTRRLAITALEGVNVDQCSFCEGVFLDAGELDSLFLKHDSERKGVLRKLLRF